MRFVAGGPALPDDLLAARDAGQVVFFCGAGVSLARAGLPDFPTLAERVIARLGAATASPARQLLDALRRQRKIPGVGGQVAADRIFSLLEREFEVGDIRAAVAAELRPATSDLSAHKLLLDLARGPDGQVRLVTTNFDPLFQATDPRLRVHAPPTLPDPRRPQDISGLIHLHGRVRADYTGAQDDEFVLSSADFGRAYLAEGWGTRFIQGILEGFKLVFIGYAADDPPVQYLLEALGKRGLARGDLYAFHAGTPEDGHALWRSRGVQAIAYDDADRHAALWNNLEAWAVRARDPAAWEARVLRRARRGPEPLAPHERGWVKHLAMYPASARKIAEARLPAEWLCVFDPALRYAPPEHTYDGTPGFNPFEAYGLDDDIPPPPPDPDRIIRNREIPQGTWDAFAPSAQDGLADGPHAGGWFRGPAATSAANLSPRHAALTQWLVEVAETPIAVWWAAGQRGLHPDTLRMILARFHREPNLEGQVAAAWRRLQRSWADLPRTPHRSAYELAAEVRRDGWTSRALYALEQLLTPTLQVNRPYGRGRPPRAGRNVRPNHLLQLDTKHPYLAPPLDVPNGALADVLEILRRAVARGQDLIDSELQFEAHPLPPITPDPDVVGGGFDHTHGLARPFFDYLALFRRLMDLDVVAARREAMAWRLRGAAFERLRIWSAGEARLTDGDAAAHQIGELSDDAFWHGRHQRDLLLSLQARWADFTPSARRSIQQRILKGRARWWRETGPAYRRGRAVSSLHRLQWLEAAGCRLEGDLSTARRRLETAAPGLDPNGGLRAAESLESRGGTVGEDPDPSGLDGVRPRELLAVAQRIAEPRGFNSLTEHRPLVGLVAAQPSRLLAALRQSSPEPNTAAWAWRHLLASEAPRLERPRVRRLIAARLARLPDDHLAPLLHAVTDWLRRATPDLANDCPAIWDALWAALINALAVDPDRARSGVRSSSPQWMTSALNAPTGDLIRALMRHPSHETPPGQGFDPAWRDKVDTLLDLPGDGGRYAAVLLMTSLPWVLQHEPDWGARRLLALRDGNARDRAAYLAGLLRQRETPPLDVFVLILPDLMRAVADPETGIHHADALASWILSGWLQRPAGDHPIPVSDTAMREALIAGSDAFRGRILWGLQRLMNGDGGGSELRDRVLHMIEAVWPRQHAVRTVEMTERLIELAFAADDQFPRFADAVAAHLVVIDDPYNMSLHLEDGAKADIAASHPNALLVLLHAVLPTSPRSWPWGARDLVDVLLLVPHLKRDPRLAELRRRLASG